MADSTTNFYGLPAEVRCQIWELALIADWSVTGFQVVKNGIRIAGKTYHRRVGKICRDAQQLMRYRLTEIEGLGWFQLSQHLFFFRDIQANGKLMSYVADHYDLLPKIQHLCINPRSERYFFKTLDFIATRCDSLCTVVIVAPWIIPPGINSQDPAADWTIYNPEWTQKWFRSWPRVSSQSLTKFDWDSLVKRADEDGEETKDSIEDYRSTLDKAMLRMSDPLLRSTGYEPTFDLIHYNIMRELNTLDRVQQIFEKCASTPTLLLKPADEFCDEL